MNDVCIDIDYSQLFKSGQKIGGDVFLLDRNPGSNIITATLSDGLGSGVKANVLASLTSHMANKLSFSPMDLSHSAEIIMDTLPVDREKGISYSTFTIARVAFADDKSFISTDLVEYDNPASLRFSYADPVEWDKHATRLRRKAAIKEEIVYASSFDMKLGDRLIFFSDGVAQAGAPLGAFRDEGVSAQTPRPGSPHRINAAPPEERLKEWGIENVQAFIRGLLLKDPSINSRDLARAIVTEAYKRDSYHPNDDITCAVVAIRKPRRVLIITGAPRNKESDRRLGEMIRDFDGYVIVCGGTTAKIVARELGKDVKADKSPSGSLPPASIIDGIDLVTEGMLTLAEVGNRLEDKILLKHMPEDPAKRIIKILREIDQAQIVVGTKINDDTDDPAAAAKIGVRFPVIEKIVRSLERNYLKEVEVRYL